MKKITALILTLVVLLSLASCGAEYEPVPSTKEEATTVWTLTLDGEEYEVKYELYRALFLNYRDEVDGGDRTVWQGDDKQEYIEKIEEIILRRAADIYATFAVCKKIGFDPYSSDVDEKIEEYIKAGVEGGTVAGTTVLGHGSYEEYLKSLKEANLNYSVQTLLYRYYIATDAIDSYYIGTLDAENFSESITEGAFEYTREDVLDFYESDGCVRVLRRSIRADIDYEPAARAERERELILSAAESGKDAVAAKIFSLGTLTSIDEVESGYIIAKYNLDEAYYKEMTDAAFELSPGEVSPVIEINDGFNHTFYIMYGVEKDTDHFDECYPSIAYIYLKNEVGKILDAAKGSLIDSASESDFLKQLVHSEISMNKSEG